MNGENENALQGGELRKAGVHEGVHKQNGGREVTEHNKKKEGTHTAWKKGADRARYEWM